MFTAREGKMFSLYDMYKNDLQDRYEGKTEKRTATNSPTMSMPMTMNNAPFQSMQNQPTPVATETPTEGMSLYDYDNMGQDYGEQTVGTRGGADISKYTDPVFNTMLNLWTMAADVGVPGLGAGMRAGINTLRDYDKGNLSWNSAIKNVGKEAIGYVNPASKVLPAAKNLTQAGINMVASKPINMGIQSVFNKFIDFLIPNTTKPTVGTEDDPFLAVAPEPEPSFFGSDEDPYGAEMNITRDMYYRGWNPTGTYDTAPPANHTDTLGNDISFALGDQY